MAHPWRSEEKRADYFEKQEVIADCSKCVSEEVCKYRHDYECPHFKNKADYVEVKHGEWIKKGNERTCPRCGYFFINLESEEDNYCSNCGAKMDGGKKE